MGLGMAMMPGSWLLARRETGCGTIHLPAPRAPAWSSARFKNLLGLSWINGPPFQMDTRPRTIVQNAIVVDYKGQAPTVQWETATWETAPFGWAAPPALLLPQCKGAWFDSWPIEANRNPSAERIKPHKEKCFFTIDRTTTKASSSQPCDRPRTWFWRSRGRFFLFDLKVAFHYSFPSRFPLIEGIIGT